MISCVQIAVFCAVQPVDGIRRRGSGFAVRLSGLIAVAGMVCPRRWAALRGGLSAGGLKIAPACWLGSG